MAGSLNKVMLIGRVGKDPEVKRQQNGGMIVNFSIATSDTWRDKNTGERKEKTEWHNIVIFNEGVGKVAEQYVRKGSQIYIEGKLRTRSWETQQGEKKFTTEVVLEQFGGQLTLLDNRSEGGGSGSSGGGSGGGKPKGEDYAGQSGAAGAAAGSGFNRSLDDEIPFAPEFR